MSTLPNCKKLEVRNSPIEGFGVFATDTISKGEVLEEVPFILFPRHTNISRQLYDMLGNNGFLSSKEKYYDNLRQNLKFKDPEKYYFKWFPQIPYDGDPIAFTVLPLGFGPIYNTANVDNNAGWRIKEKTFEFIAEKDIQKEEEIRTFYGYFVTENGTVYNCESVFNLAFDSFEGQPRLKMVRFGSIEQYEAGKQNQSYIRLAQLFNVAENGLFLQRIAAVLPPNPEEKAAFDFPTDAPLSLIYNKLAEFRQSPFPLFKLTFQWKNKETQNIDTEIVVLRK